MPTCSLLDTVQSVPEVAKAHDQVAGYYRAEILSGSYSDGRDFPSVREIVEAWRVSPNTARRALSVLKDEGRIDYSQGRRPTVLPEGGEPHGA